MTLQELFSILLGILLFYIGIFLLLRRVFIWYFKIDKYLDYQKEILEELKRINQKISSDGKENN